MPRRIRAYHRERARCGREPGRRSMPFGSRKLLSIAVATVGVAALAQGAPHAAHGLMKPNIKPGLWEVSHHPQVTGQVPIPEEQLAKLTPEQRARMEAALKNYAAN